MKKDVVELFKELHDSGSFVRSLNSSFLLLIAKGGGVHNIKDFRPISLVGSIYKLIVKVHTRGMTKVLESLKDWEINEYENLLSTFSFITLDGSNDQPL